MNRLFRLSGAVFDVNGVFSGAALGLGGGGGLGAT